MNAPVLPDPEAIIEYRVRQLERRLADDYLTREAMNNRFITKEQLREEAAGRREWWPIMIGAAVLAIQVTNLVVLLRGSH